MSSILDLFDDLTDLVLEGMRDKNSFKPYIVQAKFNSEPGQNGNLQFILYPIYQGYVEEKATAPEYVVLKEKTGNYKQLLNGLGMKVDFVDINDENIEKASVTRALLPLGQGTPAWTLYGEVPDTALAMKALKLEIAKLQPDGSAAKDRLRELVEEIPADYGKNLN